MKQSLSITTFFILMIAALIFMAFPARAQEPDWLRRVKQQKWMKKVADLNILKTNRAEAESILGKPDKSEFDADHQRSESYILKDGNVDIDYTTKECNSVDGKIAKDTIEEMRFYLEKEISFFKLNLPHNQFKYQPFPDTDGGSYENEQTGVSIHVHLSGAINSIHFKIPEQKNFNCVTPVSFLSDLEKIKNIKLLEANRDDVGNIFAGYRKLNDFSNPEYKDGFSSGDAEFVFFYSEGKCLFDNEDGYGSDKWNVQSVDIYPANSIDPKEYGIDLTKYKEEQMYVNRSDLYIFYDKDAGISFRVLRGKIDIISFFPQRKDYSLMCHKEWAKMLASSDSLFTESLKDRFYDENVKASIETLTVSQNKIILNCDSSGAIEDKDCLNNPQTINVFTRVNNPFDERLTYSYRVTGGKIIGQGAKIVWDLSGVKTGAYKITAAIDDGCGFCGADKTKTVVVK